ncbi:MAG: cupin domain-containing protein [Nocardioides sp.]|nr:cupin domain-containing protein [Nocardioides sp.]
MIDTNPGHHAVHTVATGEGKTVDLGVARMRVLADADVTDGGEFSLVEFSGDTAGAWTVPHLHRQMIESFYVLEGSFTFTVGEQQVDAVAGTYLVVPHATSHMIEAGQGGGRFLTLMVPGGLEQMFLELAELPGTGLTDHDTRQAISAKYDSVPI